MDKAFIVIIAFALIVFIAVVVIKYVYTIPSLVPGLSFIKTNTETTSCSVDLRQIALPYLARHPDTDCYGYNGDWYWQDNLVGCKNARVSAIDCSGPVTRSAGVQCEGAGGVWSCNSRNAYCTLTNC
jgi:hypothetical protein